MVLGQRLHPISCQVEAKLLRSCLLKCTHRKIAETYEHRRKQGFSGMQPGAESAVTFQIDAVLRQNLAIPATFPCFFIALLNFRTKIETPGILLY